MKSTFSFLVLNEDIRDRVCVAPIEEKLTEYRLGWFGHVHWGPPKASVHSGVLKLFVNVNRGRGRVDLN